MDMKYLLILALLVGCQKKTTTPSGQTQNTQTVTKVWCFYQMNFGYKAFFKCCKTQQEYNDTYQQGINNGLNLSYEIKNDCNECQ